MTKRETLAAIRQMGGNATMKDSKETLTSILASLKDNAPAPVENAPAPVENAPAPVENAPIITPMGNKVTPAPKGIYYKLFNGNSCTDAITSADYELFTFIDSVVRGMYPAHNVNVNDIPMVQSAPTTKTTKSAGVVSALTMNIVTRREVRVSGSNEYKLQDVVIASIDVNNGAAIDSVYYWDPREANETDIAKGRYTTAIDADGHIIRAKTNANGNVVKRKRDIMFILTHSVKRELDITIERRLREKGYRGDYYIKYKHGLLVD